MSALAMPTTSSDVAESAESRSAMYGVFLPDIALALRSVGTNSTSGNRGLSSCISSGSLIDSTRKLQPNQDWIQSFWYSAPTCCPALLRDSFGGIEVAITIPLGWIVVFIDILDVGHG